MHLLPVEHVDIFWGDCRFERERDSQKLKQIASE